MQRSRRLCPNVCRRLLTGCLVASLFFAAGTRAQEQRSESSRPAQPAVSFDGLVHYLQHGVREKEADAILIKLIERFGLAFRPTPEQLAHLRDLAASQPIFTAITNARLPAPAPAPPDDAALSITCAPLDCDLWANNAPLGRTTGGVIPWVKLRPGPVAIVASRADYDLPPDRKEFVLAAGERRNIAFATEPSRTYLSGLGARLLERMLRTVASPAATQTRSVRAVGTLYLRERDGRITSWSISAWIRGAELVRMDASRLNERYTFPKHTVPKKRTAATKGPPQLATAAALLPAALLQHQISLLKAPGMMVEATDTKDQVFSARGPSGSYLVELDQSFRPTQIRYQDDAHTDSATYVYSEYSEFDGFLWPGLIQVTNPGSQVAFEARFADLKYSDEPAGRNSGRNR